MLSPIDRRTLLSASAASLALAFTTTVRAEDTPAAATAATSSPRPTLEVFAKSPAIDQIALSPDGTRIALISQKGDIKYLIYFAIAEQKSTRMTLGPIKTRNLFFVDNDHVILENSLTKSLPQFTGSKNEFYLARNINLKTGVVTTLFDKMENFYGMVEGNLQPILVDGTYRIAASNYRMGPPENFPLCLYSFPLDGGVAHEIYEGSQDTEGWILTPDGRPLAYSEFDRLNQIWYLYYNTAPPGKSAEFKIIYKVKEPLDSPDLIGLGRDGQSVVIRLNASDTDGAYHEISASGTLSEPLDPEGSDKDHRPLFHPITWRLVGFSRHDDWISHDYFDPLMKKLDESLPQVMDPGYRLSVIDYAHDPRKMIVYGESPNDAGSYFYIDFSTGAATLLGRNYPDIPEDWVTQKQPIDYKAADGLNIHAYLTLPPYKTAKDLPLIVLPHGGPQVRDFVDFDWQVQALAAHGYAVLQPNYRGSSGYGGDFVEAGHGEFGRKMQTDLSDGVRHLVKQGLVDPKRVAILGASYGGYAALAGATIDTGVYNCAVDVAGIAGLRSFLDFVEEKTDSRESSSVLYWKQFWGDAKRWDEISPVKQAKNASCPILIIHGTDDTVVPISESQEMERALKAAGKDVEFITYKGQDHWETIESSRVNMMQTIITFLDKHNPAT